MNETTVIVTQAHPDDACASVGSIIAASAENAVKLRVVTVCDGDPDERRVCDFAEKKSRQEWRSSPTACMAVRRAEDARALETLGVTRSGLGLPDAVFRRGIDGKDLVRERADCYRGQVSGDWLLESATESLAQIPRADLLLAPLGLGNHIDHVATRLAVETLSGSSVCYYADQPYTCRRPRAVSFATSHLHRIDICVKPPHLVRQLQALRAYRSQQQSLQRGGISLPAIVKFWGGIVPLWVADDVAGEVVRDIFTAANGSSTTLPWSSNTHFSDPGRASRTCASY